MQPRTGEDLKIDLNEGGRGEQDYKCQVCVDVFDCFHGFPTFLLTAVEINPSLINN